MREYDRKRVWPAKRTAGPLSRFGRALALAASLIPAIANGQELVNPSWAVMPDADAMSEAYPAFAYMAGLEGAATLRCAVAPDGVLSLCRVDEARPAGLGFDRAGLSVASLFRASPARLDGSTITSSVRFTIRFQTEKEEAPLPWTGPEPTPEHLAATREFVEQLESWKLRGDEEIETMNLDVDPDREPRVRAIFLAVKAEFLEREKETGTLFLARLLTPEQLADAVAGRGDQPVPPDELYIRASDAWDQMGIDSGQRLKQLYCAEFDCRTGSPVSPATP